jgi:hypothetical protein
LRDKIITDAFPGRASSSSISLGGAVLPELSEAEAREAARVVMRMRREQVRALLQAPQAEADDPENLPARHETIVVGKTNGAAVEQEGN